MSMSYSNIQEAWNHDPVKEITKKLSSNKFNIFDDRSQACYSNLVDNSATRNPPKRLSQTPPDLSFTANEEEEIIDTISSTSFEPNYHFRSEFSSPKFPKNRKRARTFDSENKSFNNPHSRCSGHIKKCNHCYKTLKKLVNAKIRSKIDELILDNKLKQIQIPSTPVSTTPYPLIQPFTTSQPVTTIHNDSWKETLIVMLGGIIALVLIYLIVRTFCQSNSVKN